MTRWMTTLALVLASASVSAQTPDEAYFGGRQLSPTDEEADVLRALATNRPHGAASTTPIVNADKSVRFTFGGSLPVIICAPLQVCDIELQPGEHVRSVQVGDTVRWTVEPAVTGVAPDETMHVVIRPADVGLRTSLVVTTDRRTYRMKLASDAEQYMASVSFAYPEDSENRWKALSTQAEANRPSRRRERAISNTSRKGATKGSMDSLSFNYELEGDDPPWKPARVYNDGLQTVIEMPFAMKQTEAPTLLVVRAEGGLFTDDDVVQVNFRVKGTKYVVDTVFDIADLVVGVGSSQQKVRIRRTR